MAAGGGQGLANMKAELADMKAEYERMEKRYDVLAGTGNASGVALEEMVRALSKSKEALDKMREQVAATEAAAAAAEAAATRGVGAASLAGGAGQGPSSQAEFMSMFLNIQTGIESLHLELRQRNDNLQVEAASNCSTQTWARLQPKLQAHFQFEPARLPPCCLGSVEAATAKGVMVWAEDKENSKANVKKMVAHLEGEVCPPGAKVWPVQSVGWLSTCINLGLQGSLTITSSKTDFIVLTEAAWDSLDHQFKTGTAISGQHLLEVLPLTLAFYEAKTTKALKADPGKAVRQGVLELLAGDAMRSCPDHLLVLVGDGNVHYSVHFSEDGHLHVANPLPLQRISEGSVASAEPPSRDRGTLAVAKALLSRALCQIQARLATQGASPSTQREGGSASGAGGGGAQTQGSTGTRAPPAPQGTGRGGGGAAGQGQPSTSFGAASMPQGSQASATSDPCSADDEGVLAEEVFARQFSQALRLPGMLGDLRLQALPAFQPLSKEAYAASWRPMVPDGQGGWTSQLV